MEKHLHSAVMTGYSKLIKTIYGNDLEDLFEQMTHSLKILHYYSTGKSTLKSSHHLLVACKLLANSNLTSFVPHTADAFRILYTQYKPNKTMFYFP